MAHPNGVADLKRWIVPRMVADVQRADRQPASRRERREVARFGNRAAKHQECNANRRNNGQTRQGIS